MSTTANRRIVLAARPSGKPTAASFRLEEAPVPKAGPGELVCRNLYLSLDPYMRGRMAEGRSYASPVEIGQTMVGGTVGQVVDSQADGIAAGDFVTGQGGWQDYALFRGTEVRKVDPGDAPLSTALGVLGMPGRTAYVGLRDIGRPKAGETVVVAAASGPVGSLVGQLAALQGARVVGIAGSAAKCRDVVERYGFEACLDHHATDLPEQLAAACPRGIDVYWENVGGRVLEAVLPLLNDFARVPVCGLIAWYNATGLHEGPDRLPALMRMILTRRLLVQGFIVTDRPEGDFRADVGRQVREGRIHYREDIREGLEQAPSALIGLLEGENLGKLLIRLAPDPTR